MGQPDPVLFLDDHRGVNIPRDFAACVARDRVSGVTDEQYADLGTPDSETYWDTWSEVCESAVLTGTDGVKYRLYQDGALWLIPDGMEWSDARGWHIWPQASVAIGDRFIATGPGECFETGKVYTVVAVYDGQMDLECPALDTTVAGVQIDDPSLEPYTAAV